MRNETDYKTYLVKKFKKLGHYGRRIEDKYGVGFPDLILGIRDYPIFIVEAKVLRNRTHFEPTERQGIELTRLSLSPKHIVPCLLAFDEQKLYLHPPASRAIIADCTESRDDETVVQFFQRFYHERMEHLS